MDKGADIRHMSKINKSVVYLAACFGTVEILEYLLSLGCDVNQKTKHGKTPLSRACFRKRADTVAVLLKHPDIDIEQRVEPEGTALHTSVDSGSRNKATECVKLLLAAGANVDSHDDENRTPLIIACSRGGT